LSRLEGQKGRFLGGEPLAMQKKEH